MASLRSLIVNLAARTAQFEWGMNRAQSRLDAFHRTFKLFATAYFLKAPMMGIANFVINTAKASEEVKKLQGHWSKLMETVKKKIILPPVEATARQINMILENNDKYQAKINRGTAIPRRLQQIALQIEMEGTSVQARSLNGKTDVWENIYNRVNNAYKTVMRKMSGDILDKWSHGRHDWMEIPRRGEMATMRGDVTDIAGYLKGIGGVTTDQQEDKLIKEAEQHNKLQEITNRWLEKIAKFNYSLE